MKQIRSVEDWLALPQLDIPIVLNESKMGKVYPIKKVGFAAVFPEDCEKHDIAADVKEGGRCLLPTCVVNTPLGDVLYRLPTSLAQWTFNAVGLSSMGMNPFPCSVEFGLLRDREYAEML